MRVGIVYGAVRSGSTMLRLMIDGHPNFSCTGEHDYLFDHIIDCNGHLAYDLESLGSDRIFLSQNLTRPAHSDFARAFPDLLRQIHQAGGAETTVLMLHRNLARVLEVLPDATIIHLLRDPRDVARSCIGMGWDGHVYRAARNWEHVERDWQAQDANRTQSATDIRFENLVSDPRSELDRLCEAFGYGFDEAMLDYPRWSSYAAPSAKYASQWQRKMSARDIRWVEARVGHLMNGAGYTRTDEPPMRLTAVHRLWAGALSGSLRHVFQLRRYGFAHLAHIAGRMLGWDRLKTFGQRRKQGILEARYLQ